MHRPNTHQVRAGFRRRNPNPALRPRSRRGRNERVDVHLRRRSGTWARDGLRSGNWQRKDAQTLPLENMSSTHSCVLPCRCREAPAWLRCSARRRLAIPGSGSPLWLGSDHQRVGHPLPKESQPLLELGEVEAALPDIEQFLTSAGIRCLRLPPRSPNLNAFAELAISQRGCLSKLILFGESSLPRLDRIRLALSFGTQPSRDTHC